MKFEFYKNGIDKVVGEVEFEGVNCCITLENQKTAYFIGEFVCSVVRRRMGGIPELEMRSIEN